MATVDVAQHTMTFLGVLNEALQLAYGLRSVRFGVQALRRLLWQRHEERSELWVAAAAAAAGAARTHDAEPAPPSLVPAWSMRSPTRTGHKCAMCDADVFPRAAFCSPDCEHMARLWLGDC